MTEMTPETTTDPAIKQTALHAEHVAAAGKMVDFAGWSMPVNYGSQIEEHQAVRGDAGMFDVSHMTIIDVSGTGARQFLRTLVANDVDKLEVWGALYGALLNTRGGVIDDLIVYRLPDEAYRCVVNASTRDKVLAWFADQAAADVEFVEQPLSMIAVQGPNARTRFAAASGSDAASGIKPFSAVEIQADSGVSWLVGRTGYTGEDGVEVMLPDDDAVALWRRLLEVGVVPAGLGARDTLRLEAGLNLYGQDLDEDTSPLASNIGWTVQWTPEDRQFVGREAIEPTRDACPQKLVGLLLRDKGVLRHGQSLTTPHGTGEVTSGSFAPSLGRSIGLARVPAAATGVCQVDIRGKAKEVIIVQPPFVRNGKIRVDLD